MHLQGPACQLDWSYIGAAAVVDPQKYCSKTEHLETEFNVSDNGCGGPWSDCAGLAVGGGHGVDVAATEPLTHHFDGAAAGDVVVKLLTWDTDIGRLLARMNDSSAPGSLVSSSSIV